LAYTAPLVAASFKLSADGALAVTAAICPPGAEFVAGTTNTPPQCCQCSGCTTGIAHYDTARKKCGYISRRTGNFIACGRLINCHGTTQSLR